MPSYKQITMLDSAQPRFLNHVLNQDTRYSHPNQEVSQLHAHRPIELLICFKQFIESRLFDALTAPVVLAVSERMRTLLVNRRDRMEFVGGCPLETHHGGVLPGEMQRTMLSQPWKTVLDS